MNPAAARARVADALRTVPGLTVWGYPAAPDAITPGGTAIIAADSVDYRADYATPNLAPVSVTAYLLAGAPDTDPGGLFDTLDALLVTAAAAVEAAGLAPTGASLDTYADTLPTWALTVEVPL